MSFNSIEFLIFLVLCVGFFYAFPERSRKWFLLAVSGIFYCFWSIGGVVWLAALALLVFLSALKLQDSSAESAKKTVLTAAIGALLANLVCFKYFAFDGMGWLVPVGISYVTFRLIGYLLDVYWEKIPAEKNFYDFALYTAFFPQILSGPIQRAGDFLSQIKRLKEPDPKFFVSGLSLILFGFFKKLVVADRLALLVGNVFSHPADFSGVSLWIGAYAFCFQLYADFSGITDIARGSARLFGIESPINFDSPLKASNIQDFWRRWHITLSSWIGDYLFTPLRMITRRMGDAGLVICLFISMTAIGVWHGWTPNYLLFGAIHGTWMAVSALTLKPRQAFFKRHTAWGRLHRIWAPILTFHGVVLSFIVFRCGSLAHTAQYFRGLLPIPLPNGSLSLGVGRPEALLLILAVFLMQLIHWGMKQKKMIAFFEANRFFRWSAYYALFFLILSFSAPSSKNFIYFQF